MRAHAGADDGGSHPEHRQGDPAATPAQPVNPLQRLIAARLQERGWSYGEVARRSGLPRSTVSAPASAARAAAAASPGMHSYDEPPADPRRTEPGDQERELLIASIDELSAED